MEQQLVKMVMTLGILNMAKANRIICSIESCKADISVYSGAKLLFIKSIRLHRHLQQAGSHTSACELIQQVFYHPL